MPILQWSHLFSALMGSTLWPRRKLMTVAKQQHARECEQEHQSENVLMEELGRLLGEFKASARYNPPPSPPLPPRCSLL